MSNSSKVTGIFCPLIATLVMFVGCGDDEQAIEDAKFKKALRKAQMSMESFNEGKLSSGVALSAVVEAYGEMCGNTPSYNFISDDHAVRRSIRALVQACADDSDSVSQFNYAIEDSLPEILGVGVITKESIDAMRVPIKEVELVEKWHDAGVSQTAFARDNGYSRQEFEQLIDRVVKRKALADK